MNIVDVKAYTLKLLITGQIPRILEYQEAQLLN